MSKYIFSTLTANHKYPTYKSVEGRDAPNMVGYVLIHGGANLASKVLVTPKGVMTKVSDEEFDRLNLCPAFKRHVDRGFLVVEDAPHDPEAVAADMKEKDKSAPMVPEDFEKAGQKPPTTATIEDDPDTTNVRASQRPAQASTKDQETEAPKTGRKKRGRPRKTEKEASA